MSNERIIKQQARQALKGNLSVLIAGMGAVAVMVLMLDLVLQIPAIMLHLVDTETGLVKDGMQLNYVLLAVAAAILSVLASPLFNGFLKLAANTAVQKSCGITDMFYYFGNPVRFFKTVLINMALCCIFVVLTEPVGVVCDSFDDLWFAPALTVGLVLWRIIVYIFLIHYPLAAYTLNDSRALPHYLFGYIEFSFRHCGALIKLLLTMAGWIALCFFVVPAVYVVPYLAVVLMNSARWLLAVNQKV